ncbi:hypothetical protein GGTG_09546 [Gaeumannomyces tritici R3-111a-1]|uniref:Uncharacterized protein n=1 Tax=Gaeumannomyces tritici (strain R3-111a-1) TaxID=644352 RepID=J3P7Q4_GAET3|nr:hypothetical protein GGTG_09546 [Gaeumannomyces tritici R3-111a-1]EJT72687.1 hypothetical protein GGTG_09546 [Gaeumannomyces tritici R3-111a-1]
MSNLELPRKPRKQLQVQVPHTCRSRLRSGYHSVRAGAGTEGGTMGQFAAAGRLLPGHRQKPEGGGPTRPGTSQMADGVALRRRQQAAVAALFLSLLQAPINLNIIIRVPGGLSWSIEEAAA